jgi:uncharacterized membrane protein YuzA (DUF378 family)
MFKSYMRGIDVCVAVLLVIGGLNWGLVAFFGFDLVAYLFGSMTFASRIVYGLVGICAVYQAIMWRSIQRRWECAGFMRPAESTSH